MQKIGLMQESAYIPDPQVLIDGIRLDLRRKGAGRPLLFLQGAESWVRDETFSDALAAEYEVIMPQLPGFGLSEFPADFRSIGDMAQFGLTLLDELDLRDAILVGTSFGGWVAAEMAVRCCARLQSVVLVDAFGIRNSTDPFTRDIQDIYAMSDEETGAYFYHDARKNRRDVSDLPDHVLLSIARSRETMCYLGWKPYMHTPGLKRWLRRIRVPALVLWGESDRVMPPDYGRAYCEAIRGARFRTIAEAGHYPHLENPEDFVSEIRSFLKAHGCGPTVRHPSKEAGLR